MSKGKNANDVKSAMPWRFCVKQNLFFLPQAGRGGEKITLSIGKGATSPKGSFRHSFIFGQKSQMEIMGLAIMVVLALIGMLFAVKYMATEEQPRTEASDRQIAAAFLNTMLADKLEVASCKQGVELKELLQDCTAPSEPDLRNTCSDGKTYCDTAKEVSAQLLKGAFEKRKKNYEFKLYTAGSAIPIISHQEGCKPESDRVQSTYPMPTKYETIFLTLTLCS